MWAAGRSLFWHSFYGLVLELYLHLAGAGITDKSV